MRAQRLKMGEVIHAPPVRNRLFKCQGEKGKKVVLTLEKFHLNEVSKWSWQLLTNGSFISSAPHINSSLLATTSNARSDDEFRILESFNARTT